MATRTLNVGPSNSTDAGFRAWINEINSALLAFGWTATADTGQINFSTVTRPTATNTYPGYAMYQMGDSLQSTTAVFMRLDFGTAGSTDAPGLKFILGIGATNGSGTITGIVTSQITMTGEVATTTQSYLRTCGTSSSFCLTAWLTGQPTSNTSFRGFVFCVERDQSSSGADQANGISWVQWSVGTGGAITRQSQYVDAAGGLGTLESLCYAMVTASSSQSGGGVVGVGPIKTQYGAFRNPMKRLLIVSSPDFIGETMQPVVIYGAQHNYLIQKPCVTISASLNGWQSAANAAWAMLWE